MGRHHAGRMGELYIALYEHDYIGIADFDLVQNWLAALVQTGYQFPPLATLSSPRVKANCSGWPRKKRAKRRRGEAARFRGQVYSNPRGGYGHMNTPRSRLPLAPARSSRVPIAVVSADRRALSGLAGGGSKTRRAGSALLTVAWIDNSQCAWGIELSSPLNWNLRVCAVSRKAPAVENFAWLPVGFVRAKSACSSVSLI